MATAPKKVQETTPGITIRTLVLKDGTGNETTMDLLTGEFYSQSMQRSGKIKVEGDGDRLTLPLDTLVLWGGDVIEFDPIPDQHPLVLTLS